MKFYLWITLLTELSVDLLVSGLVKKGFNVGPLSMDKNLCVKNYGSCMVALDLEFELKKTGSDAVIEVMGKVKDVLTESSILWLSHVISENRNVACSWNVGNITESLPDRKTDLERINSDKDIVT